jgi:hypothetical protein
VLVVLPSPPWLWLWGWWCRSHGCHYGGECGGGAAPAVVAVMVVVGGDGGASATVAFTLALVATLAPYPSSALGEMLVVVVSCRRSCRSPGISPPPFSPFPLSISPSSHLVVGVVVGVLMGNGGRWWEVVVEVGCG